MSVTRIYEAPMRADCPWHPSKGGALCAHCGVRRSFTVKIPRVNARERLWIGAFRANPEARLPLAVRFYRFPLPQP